MSEDKLSPIQEKYKEVFGDLNCPVCKKPIEWDLHPTTPDFDWGMCDNSKCDVLVSEETDITEIKSRIANDKRSGIL